MSDWAKALRPEYPCLSATSSMFPVETCAICTAVSSASVPLAVKKHFCSAPGVMRASRSASSTMGTVG